MTSVINVWQRRPVDMSTLLHCFRLYPKFTKIPSKVRYTYVLSQCGYFLNIIYNDKQFVKIKGIFFKSHCYTIEGVKSNRLYIYIFISWIVEEKMACHHLTRWRHLAAGPPEPLLWRSGIIAQMTLGWRAVLTQALFAPRKTPPDRSPLIGKAVDDGPTDGTGWCTRKEKFPQSMLSTLLDI